MRKKLLLLQWLCMMCIGSVYAQTVITTAYTASAGTGQCIGNTTKLSFDITNNNGGPIIITSVGLAPAATGTHNLYYSTTSLSGAVGGTLAPPTWNLAGTANATATSTTINNNFFSGLTVIIPGNTTYRFCAEAPVVRMVSNGTPTTFTNSGVSIVTAGTLWGCSGNLTGYRWYGSITFAPACNPSPTGLNATNITGHSATVSWNPISGNAGFDYIVDQNATSPTGVPFTTNATSANVNGLTPSTTYYLHVRNKCSSTASSVWSHYPFTTLPPCDPPTGFTVKDLKINSAGILWNKWPSAKNYDYIVNQSADTPTATTGAINTVDTFASLTGLTENTWYYVHIRSHCDPNEISDWSLDSFLTPIECRAPNVKISHVNTDEAVAFWNTVPTATHYEYAINTSATPPADGTKFMYTSIHMPVLDDGKDYYVHVRSHCISIGVVGESPWTTASFKTFPLSVNTATGSKLTLSVYPNPVNDVLHIALYGIRSGAAAVTLMDVSGKVLLQSEVDTDDINISVADLPSGIYLIKYQDQATSRLQKFTKQ